MVLRNVRSGSQGSQPFARVGLATEYSLRILLSLQTTFYVSHSCDVIVRYLWGVPEDLGRRSADCTKKVTPERRSVPLGNYLTVPYGRLKDGIFPRGHSEPIAGAVAWIIIVLSRSRMVFRA